MAEDEREVRYHARIRDLPSSARPWERPALRYLCRLLEYASQAEGGVAYAL